jgi:hypothetical protein
MLALPQLRMGSVTPSEGETLAPRTGKHCFGFNTFTSVEFRYSVYYKRKHLGFPTCMALLRFFWLLGFEAGEKTISICPGELESDSRGLESSVETLRLGGQSDANVLTR